MRWALRSAEHRVERSKLKSSCQGTTSVAHLILSKPYLPVKHHLRHFRCNDVTEYDNPD